MKVENYINVKRCKGKAQGGCGELFEKNDTNFFVFKKLNRTGKIRLEYSPVSYTHLTLPTILLV